MTTIRAQGMKSMIGLACVLVITGVAVTAHAQAPIQIGASLSRTGQFAELGTQIGRGYHLCVKLANGKGGVLGRKLELTIEDDQSTPAVAAAIYDRLIVQKKVGAILSPFSSPLTEVVADIAERHKLPLVAAGALAPSIWKKGRKFVFMLLTPTDGYVRGVIDMAARGGLKTIALIYEDTPFPKSVAEAAELGLQGLELVAKEAYPSGTKDFSTPLGRIRARNPDVLIAATYFEDSVAITGQLKELNINPRMFSVTVGGGLPKFSEFLGSSADFVYVPTQWEPEFITLRAGGLIPIARYFPGAQEFVDAFRIEFPREQLAYQVAQGYGACQVLLEGMRRARSMDGQRVRDAIASLDMNTTFGPFKVDADGVQLAHKMVVFQWQEGNKVIVWPQQLAAHPPRFPTPPWNQRK
jgi:branched-chain amino acid transport system substrate-binding protein